MPSPACRNLSGLKKNFIYKVSIVTKLIAIFLLAISTYAYAKEFTPPPNDVTGKVTNDKGEPLAGATVTEKGTKNSEVTKEDGSFAMRTSTTKPVFVISYIGYETKEFPAGNQTNINMVLAQSATNLNDVVVVGYGTKRQSELSSSIAVVNEKALQKGVTSPDLGTMLQGKVPGLVVSNASGHPQRGTNIVIRGVGSIGAGYSPLYVVDGIIGGSAEPNDIASVTVLKDAAATGLYGSRAANGVIIITTKGGQSGKTRVNYSASAGPSYYQTGNLHMMNSQELYDDRKEAAQNYYNDQRALNNPAFTNRTFDQYLQATIPTSVLNTNSEWQSLLTRVGYVNKQSLSVSGGDKKTSFYIGGNYYHELGTLLGEEFDRYNLRANLRHQISDRFTVTWRVNSGLTQYPNDPQNGQEAVAVQQVINVPWDPVYEADGVTPYNPYKSGMWYSNNKANYFFDSEHYSDNTKEMNFNTDLQLDVKINDWMTFSTSNRFGFSGSDQKQLLDKSHFSASFENGRITQTTSYDNNILTSNLLKMRRSYGNNNVSVILGHEYNYLSNNNTTAVGKDIPVGLDALNAAASAKTVSGTKTQTDFLSYFGQIDYNFNERYFLIGSLRSDASSLFGANNKWASFYSIGASWIINKENFMTNTTWIDLLKIRGSYGTTGNANIAPYLSLGTYGFALANTYNGLSGARPARLENPDLTWETAKTTNIGLELSVFKRVRLELDFYNRDNKDLLQNVALPAATGFSSQQRNVGSVRNRGIDINLNTVNTTGVVRWETNLNLNFNKNEVLALNQGKDIASGTMQIREGLPLRFFYMKEWAGVDPANGNPRWVRWEDANGALIHGADRKDAAKVTTTSNYNLASNLFVKSAYPDYTGGLRNDVYYKNFSLSVLCNFVQGQSINFVQRNTTDDDGLVLSKNQVVPLKSWSRWRQPGDIATHPRLVLGGNLNSAQPSSR
ncbi:MAG: SusC/RagA family TonB-linked outer membrane protein, partial [Segetibacter sp.]